MTLSRRLAVQQLTKANLDALVTDLIAGSFPGLKKPWTANWVNPMLNLISRMLADLVSQGGTLTRDVAALVKRMKKPNTKLTTFTEDEALQLLAHVEDDRLGHAWHLALAGLRRGEISGLLWSDVELVDGQDAGPLFEYSVPLCAATALAQTRRMRMAEGLTSRNRVVDYSMQTRPSG